MGRINLVGASEIWVLGWTMGDAVIFQIFYVQLLLHLLLTRLLDAAADQRALALGLLGHSGHGLFLLLLLLLEGHVLLVHVAGDLLLFLQRLLLASLTAAHF